MSKKSQKAKAPITLEEGQAKLVLIADTTYQGLGNVTMLVMIMLPSLMLINLDPFL